MQKSGQSLKLWPCSRELPVKLMDVCLHISFQRSCSLWPRACHIHLQPGTVHAGAFCLSAACLSSLDISNCSPHVSSPVCFWACCSCRGHSRNYMWCGCRQRAAKELCPCSLMWISPLLWDCLTSSMQATKPYRQSRNREKKNGGALKARENLSISTRTEPRTSAATWHYCFYKQNLLE